MPRRKTTSSDTGATAVEYALILALLVGVIVVLVTKVGRQISTLFSTVIPLF